MTLRTDSPRSWLAALLAAFACVPAMAQSDAEALERLRRDQDEILRKAERLQGMMQRLQQRYEREGKPDQVKLLREGLAHLERSGILREVASIRDDIAASAYVEAQRKQKEVVDDLERLLNILLERKSIESRRRPPSRPCSTPWPACATPNGARPRPTCGKPAPAGRSWRTRSNACARCCAPSSSSSRDSPTRPRAAAAKRRRASSISAN